MHVKGGYCYKSYNTMENCFPFFVVTDDVHFSILLNSTCILCQHSIIHCCTTFKYQIFREVIYYKVQDCQFGHNLWVHPP